MRAHIKILFLVIICVPNISSAQTFKSAFGFISEISDSWLILTREVVRQNPELFDFDDNEIKKMDSSLKSQIKKMALAGKMELLYYKDSDAYFFDNINLFIERNRISIFSKRVDQIYKDLSAQIKQAWKRSDYSDVRYCKNTRVHGVDTISYSFDGMEYGTSSYGYYFNTKSNTITLTVTCKNNKCNKVITDTELIFKNISLQ